MADTVTEADRHHQWTVVGQDPFQLDQMRDEIVSLREQVQREHRLRRDAERYSHDYCAESFEACLEEQATFWQGQVAAVMGELGQYKQLLAEAQAIENKAVRVPQVPSNQPRPIARVSTFLLEVNLVAESEQDLSFRLFQASHSTPLNIAAGPAKRLYNAGVGPIGPVMTPLRIFCHAIYATDFVLQMVMPMVMPIMEMVMSLRTIKTANGKEEYDAEQEVNALKEREAIFKKHGVPWSEMWQLPYWSPTQMLVIDTMHCIPEGLVMHEEDEEDAEELMLMSVFS
ncbi:hypothetical protein DFH07DRAFT_965941 [Mycena maculata]|uniref:Uncharacterized protein n=1 Tax=Mycena maculata TaxID=230809 RepID=A0AAD7IBD6_9AGAR|nr:hypothetical protein DFH07DRAFT_966181 [Mycena maculata]KAJ7738842.1 hypothetical protein DFH07DRAFT_965941 [Mycena maculata]